MKNWQKIAFSVLKFIWTKFSFHTTFKTLRYAIFRHVPISLISLWIDYGLFMMVYKQSKFIYSRVHIDSVYHFIRKSFSRIPLYTYISFNGPLLQRSRRGRTRRDKFNFYCVYGVGGKVKLYFFGGDINLGNSTDLN